jgi:signal transduction histidine kinase
MGVPATVRFRVTAMATAIVIVVLVGVGAGLVLNQRRTLTETLDEMMDSRVDELAAELESGAPPSLENLGEDDSVAQLVTADGRVIASSRSIDGAGPIAAAVTSGQTIRNGELAIADGAVRILTRVVETPDGLVIVHFAASRDDVDESVHTLATSLLIAVPIAAAVLAGLVWFVVGRTLRPVEQIRAEVSSIGGAALDRRVPVPQTDDEISRLAHTMNEMLDRVEEASRRQREFVADASHELRSPLTRMRSELEVDLAHPGGADPEATHRSVLEEVVGLQRLVDDLLLLAQSAALDQRDAHRDDVVDLAGVVTRAVGLAAPRPGTAIEVDAVEPVPVHGNERELARAIGNVLDNATRHARTLVRVVASSNGDTATVAVEDDGDGIAAGQHDRIFERFARGDEGRAAAAGGFGLGLAIARDIAERHRGTLTADRSWREGARFVLTLPRAE